MFKFKKHRFRLSRPATREALPGREPSSALPTFLAIAALVVSVISTGAAAWQTLLTKEQLTAGDRNRSFQALVEQGGDLCELFFPNKIKTYSYAAQSNGASIVIVAEEDISNSIYSAELSERIAAKARQLRLAFTSVSLWLTGAKAIDFSRAEGIVMEEFQYFSSPDLSDQPRRKFFAMRYVKASHTCTNDRGLTLSAGIAGLVNGESVWWVGPSFKPTQVIVASRTDLADMTLEQIRRLADKQTEELKGYDSYNQI